MKSSGRHRISEGFQSCLHAEECGQIPKRSSRWQFTHENSSSPRRLGGPGRLVLPSGAVPLLQAACKPDSVLDDHSSRRRVTAALQQPTRWFRQNGFPHPSIGALRLGAPGRYARRAEECACDPCLFGLAPCGVYHAAFITERPVRSYRTLSPLPALPQAVYFLLHWPSLRLEAQIPDVIRHTALRSPDFPPPPDACARKAAIIQPPAAPIVSRRPGVAGCPGWVQNRKKRLPGDPFVAR